MEFFLLCKLLVLIAMNVNAQDFVWTYVLSSLGYIHRKAIVRSYNITCLLFKNPKFISQKLFSLQHSPSSIGGLNLSISLPRLISFHFFKIAFLLVKKWYLVAFICISLITNDIEHFFPYACLSSLSSLRKSLFQCFAHFLSWVVCLFLLLYYFFM